MRKLHLKAGADDRNPALAPFARAPGEDNLEWGLRAVADIRSAGREEWSYLALLGGQDTLAFRLRVAQGAARADMLPSFWSSAIFIELVGDSLQGARAVQVPLFQPGTSSFAPANNGVVRGPLTDFADAERYPNIALIAFPVAQANIVARIEQFRKSRATLDALEHVLRWLSFVWGVARTPNPLNENYGFPSACMLEIAFAAEGFDLTPGLESRAACPEAIWSTARLGHKFFNRPDGKVPKGRFWTPHWYPIADADSELPAPTPPPPPAPRSRRGRGRA